MSYRNRVLLVDDDPVFLEVLKGTLEEQYEVVVVESGSAAMEYLSQTMRVDMIILDIVMPEMDGYELMEKIKTLPVCADVPVIFLTGVTGHEEEIRGLGAGVCDYIAKPFRSEVLSARVSANLRAAKRLNMEKIPKTPEELNDMELAVLQLLALSCTNEDIAERMGYSYGYTRQLVSKLLSKLHIENRKDVRGYL